MNKFIQVCQQHFVVLPGLLGTGWAAAWQGCATAEGLGLSPVC